MSNSTEKSSDVPGGISFTNLAGRVVVITGAASGLGRAMAHAFASCGASLALIDMDADNLQSTYKTLSTTYPDIDIHIWVGLVNDESAVEKITQEIFGTWGRLDVLLGNAGISMNCPTLELSGDAWRRAIDVNLNGVFYCNRASARYMIDQGRGVIINTSSMYGTVAAPNRAVYCASKAGVAMLSKSLAVEWGPLGIRVNAIAPGYVHTSLVDELVADGRMDIEVLKQHTPARRLGTPQEIAALVLFLASDNAAFINGHVAAIDGGWSANGYV